VAGDVLVFCGSEKYADYVDKNISVKQIGPDKKFARDDGELAKDPLRYGGAHA